MQIVDGELRVKLEEKEVTANGLVPIILKRYEAILHDKAVLIYEIQKLKETQPRVFSFSNN